MSDTLFKIVPIVFTESPAKRYLEAFEKEANALLKASDKNIMPAGHLGRTLLVSYEGVLVGVIVLQDDALSVYGKGHVQLNELIANTVREIQSKWTHEGAFTVYQVQVDKDRTRELREGMERERRAIMTIA